jgi:ATP-dependent DNA helicase RecQ
LSNVLLDAGFLNNVYIKICNYFQIAYGEGINEQFEFNLNHFCVKYNFPLIKTFNAMQFLDRQGIFSLSQEFTEKISLQFIISSKELIRYTSLNPHDEEIILSLLRTYPGIYEVQTPINSSLIAKKSKVSETQLHDVLKKMNEKGVIEYHAKNNDASIIFNDVREDEKTINRVLKFLDKQNKLKQKHYQSVVEYISDKKTCKSKLILNYFGEKSSKNIDKKNLKNLSKLIVQLLQKNDMDSREIQKICKSTADETIFAIQSLLEAKKIILKSNSKYSIPN